MQITHTMDLHQLPELIERRLSDPQTQCLCKYLNKTKFRTLEEVPPAVWLSLLERVRFEHPTR